MFITPAVVGDRVLVGSCSGKFYAFDRRSGKIDWSYDTSRDGRPANFHGNPLVVEGRLIVGSDVAGAAESGEDPIGHVYSFDVNTGRLHWRYPIPGGVVSEVLRHGEYAYGVAKDGTLLCLRLSDGELIWRLRPEVDVERYSLRYDAVLHEDRVVLSSVGGTVMAVDAEDGAIAWMVRLQDDPNTELVLQQGSIWLGTIGRELHRIDAVTGETLATFGLEGIPYGTPVALEDSLLLLIGGDTLARISTADGSILWRRAAPAEWSSFRPLVQGELVWVGNSQGELIAIALDNGAIRRKLEIAGAVRGFQHAGGVFYVGTLEGSLYAVEP